MFTQTTFLGASIRHFNANLGKGSSASTLTVGLVEDRTNGDLFLPPTVGSPVYFTYEDFNFFGLLTNIETVADTNGNPVYEVVVSDPRSILENTQVILGGYNGSVNGVPNLLNVYGYIENNEGFGESGENDSGLPWKKVITNITNMVTSTSNYGGPLKRNGYEYTVNLSGLPNLPEQYRLGGSHNTLLGIIDELCSAGACDYNFTMTGQNIILNTVSRINDPQIGAIANFITNTPGAKSKRIGSEHRNNTTGKFIVGGDVTALYLRYKDNTQSRLDFDPIIGTRKVDVTEQSEEDSFWENQSIWPYWGVDLDGDIIVGKGTGDKHQFELDTRHIDVLGVGSSYKTNAAEMRAVLGGQSAWENFLMMHSKREYVAINKAPETGINFQFLSEFRNYDQYEPYLEWDHVNKTIVPVKAGENGQFIQAYQVDPDNLEENIFFLRFQKLYLIGSATTDLEYMHIDPTKSAQELLDINPLIASPFSKSQVELASGEDEQHKKGIQELYEFLAEYANNYYAKRYMVKIPFVFAAVDDEIEGTIRTSLEPTDGGYLDESDFAEGTRNNLIPVDIDKLLLPDSRIQPYVRFDDLTDIDFSRLSEEDYALGDLSIIEGKTRSEDQYKQSIFVRCSLMDRVVFLDKSLAYSPRVVVELPTQIMSNIDKTKAAHDGVFREFFRGFIPDKATQRKAIEPDLYNKFVLDAGADENIEKAIDQMLSKPGSDLYSEPLGGYYVIPNMAGVTLKSNIQTYGPFYAFGADSKIEFEQDESLVPWNYGSYTLMQQAGEARVNQSTSYQTWEESGIIEFPGVPALNVGARLVAEGPLVTDIRVNIGNEVTTSYIMRTSSRRISGNGQDIEAIRKFGQESQRARRKFRKLLRKPPPPQSKYYQKRESHYVKREDSRSSHLILSGNISGNDMSVFTQPSYHSMTQIDKDYYNTAIVSLDTIFSPVSTNPYYTGSLPKFLDGSGGAFPTVKDINSFPPTGLPITKSVITVGTEVPTDGLFTGDVSPTGTARASGDYRVMALRGPLVVHGWGYGTDGNAYPASTGDPQVFATGYLNDPTGWPCGPVDLRWDNNGGVWRAGGTDVRIGRLYLPSGLPPGDSSDPTSFHIHQHNILKNQPTGVITRLFPVALNSGIPDTYVGHNFDPAFNVPSGEGSGPLVVTMAINGIHIPVYIGCEP